MSEWIKREICLPTDGEQVIVFAGQAVTAAWFEDYEGGLFHLDQERIWDGDVTHWMPLPEPPESE